MPKVDSVKEWTGSFFYCKDVPLPNQATGIPPFHNIAGTELPSWDERPANPTPGGFRLLQRRIEALTCREPELTGTDTVICWLKRRIQPCAFHGSRLLNEYTDEKDPLRFTEADLTDREYRWRVNQLVADRSQYSESCPMYTSANPAPKVIFFPYFSITQTPTLFATNAEFAFTSSANYPILLCRIPASWR